MEIVVSGSDFRISVSYTNAKFPGLDHCTVVPYENGCVPKRYIQKYLGLKYHHVGKLWSNGSTLAIIPPIIVADKE